jgi:hypothetical protein
LGEAWGELLAELPGELVEAAMQRTDLALYLL